MAYPLNPRASPNATAPQWETRLWETPPRSWSFKTLLTTEFSSKPGRAFSIASTNRFPPFLFQMNESFLYIYQEGPVGAVGNAKRFPSDCGKRCRYLCNCSQPIPKRLSRPEFPAFSAIAAASIGHALNPNQIPRNDRRTPQDNEGFDRCIPPVEFGEADVLCRHLWSGAPRGTDGKAHSVPTNYRRAVPSRCR